MPEQDFNPKDPSYYRPFFGFSHEETEYEALWQDCNYGEFIQIYGHHFDVYLCTQYQPKYVFGEDPLKRYETSSFIAYGIFDLTPELMDFGSWEKLAEQEEITIYFHKTTVRRSIRSKLLEEGIITDVDTFEDEEDLTNLERHRRDLQEGDIIKLFFNNIFYEIDGIKEEPEFQHHLWKYVYEVHARPRLVSGEELGEMQDVTRADEIREEHEDAIDEGANKIVFDIREYDESSSSSSEDYSSSSSSSEEDQILSIWRDYDGGWRIGFGPESQFVYYRTSYDGLNPVGLVTATWELDAYGELPLPVLKYTASGKLQVISSGSSVVNNYYSPDGIYNEASIFYVFYNALIDDDLNYLIDDDGNLLVY